MRKVVPRVFNHLERSVIKGVDISIRDGRDHIEQERVEVVVFGLEDRLLHSLNCRRAFGLVEELLELSLGQLASRLDRSGFLALRHTGIAPEASDMATPRSRSR